MKNKYLLLSAFALLVQYAQAQFTLDGEIRPRMEYRNGFGNLISEGTDAGFGISTRARLNAGYKTDAYSFYLSLQDVLVWGENRQILPDDQNDSFAIFQAWVDVKFSNSASVKLGRQVLSYDDQRILGGLGWAQQARNHDAAVFKLRPEGGLKIDVALAFNQDYDHATGFVSTGTEYTTTGFFSYKTMQMLHLSKKFDKFGFSVLAMNNGFQNYDDLGVADGTNDLQTFGTHLTYKSGKFSAAANAYLQTGERQGDVEVSGAHLLGLDLTYGVSDKVKLLGGAELISGATDDSAAFFPLYGTNHKFNGFMDYFYVGNHANSIGLVDIHVGAKIKTGAKSGLLVKVLNFSGAEELASGEKSLGTEVDLVFTQKFKGYALKLGYSRMFASEGMEELKGVANPQSAQSWGWAMLIVKPKFLNGAKKGAPKK